MAKIRSDRAHRVINERPELAELLASFRQYVAAEPLQIGDAVAALAAQAYELGRRDGAEHAADRVSGVLRSLSFEGRA